MLATHCVSQGTFLSARVCVHAVRNRPCSTIEMPCISTTSIVAVCSMEAPIGWASILTHQHLLSHTVTQPHGPHDHKYSFSLVTNSTPAWVSDLQHHLCHRATARGFKRFGEAQTWLWAAPPGAHVGLLQRPSRLVSWPKQCLRLPLVSIWKLSPVLHRPTWVRSPRWSAARSSMTSS